MKLIVTFILVFTFFSGYLPAQNIEKLLIKNDCFKCHNIMGIKKAPSFYMISKMNTGWFGISKKSIINSIKNGSQGKYPMFSNIKMPAFKNLTTKELNAIADWIASQGKKGMRGCNMMR